MNVDEFITDLRKTYHISLTVINNEIKLYAKKDVLTNEIIDAIKARKSEILNFLNNINDTKIHNIISQANKISYISTFAELEFGYPLSFSQERLWFIDKYEGGSNAYNISLFFKLDPSANKHIICESLKSIVSRHEILRSFIKTDAYGNGYQQVGEDALIIQELLLDDTASLNAELQAEVNYIYNLEEEYPIRARLYLVSNECFLSIMIHHIAFDGWSRELLINELECWYSYYKYSGVGTAKLSLSELTIQYKDFAVWQKGFLTGERLSIQLAYWKKKLSGFETLNLPTDKKRPPEVCYIGATLNFDLNEVESTGLRKLAHELKVSLYTVLLGGFYLLLKGYCNQNDIVVGIPVANRNYSQLKDIIGFFVNSLALRFQVNASQTISSFLQELGEDVVQAQLHQDLPFEKLVHELELPPNPSLHPVFQVMFSTDGFDGMIENRQDSPLKQYEPENSYQIAKFDLSIGINERSECIGGYFNYAVSLFNTSTIECMTNTYTSILRQLSYYGSAVEALKNVKINELQYLLGAEYEQAIEGSKKSAYSHTPYKSIIEFFDAQAKKTPDSIALVLNEEQLTYKQLYERSNQVAHYLQKRGVQPGHLIPLCIERSTCMIVSILGILMSGAAYVPVDPELPTERIAFILEDLSATIIISSKKSKSKLEIASDLKIIEIDGLDANAIISENISSLTIDSSPEQLAYVIYTSGSTGRPKGVLIGHRSVVNLINSQSAYFNIQSEERILQFSNYSFDASVEQIFLALLNGSTLILLPDGLQYDIVAFENYLRVQRITHLHATPNFLENVACNNYPDLKRVIAGGDVCFTELATKWKNYVSFYNEYGPTETTVTSIVYHYTGNNEGRSTVPIGRPISNTQIFVLDDNNRPLPLGAIGELYIGGSGLSRGYLNLPELTKERFITSPFNSRERLYKTGDLVRRLPNEVFEYIGRNDFQVKIRGYRIELGEIINVILEREDIKDVEVLVTDGKIVAFIVASGTTINVLSLKKYLRNKLPDYMIPSLIVRIDEKPLTLNGKTDQKILLSKIIDETYTLDEIPENSIEQEIAEIWKKLLNIKTVKLGDNFFDLGGHSLLLIKNILQIKEIFGLSLPLRLFFNSSLEQIAYEIREQLALKDTK